MPGMPVALAAHPSSACTRKRSSRSSTIGPYSTSRCAVAGLAIDHARAVVAAGGRSTGRRDAGESASDGARRCVERRVERLRSARPARRRARSRLGERDRRGSGRVSPGRSWPIFHSSAPMTVAGQTKPPRLGPSGPRMIGMSPVKSIAPIGVGVVVDVRGMQPRLAAVRARPVAASARSAARRCGWSCSAPPRSVAKKRVDVVGGEEIRRAVRAVEDADLPVASDQGGCERAGSGRGGRRSAARRRRRSTSPARSARPPWPPKLPEREGRAAAEIGRRRRAAADGEIGARCPGPRRGADAQQRLPGRAPSTAHAARHRRAVERRAACRRRSSAIDAWPRGSAASGR